MDVTGGGGGGGGVSVCVRGGGFNFFYHLSGEG